MNKATSPYYPPRARWYAPLFYFTRAIRLMNATDRIYLPGSITWRGLCGALLVPGMGFYLRGPRLWGRIAMSMSALLFLVFIVWLGYPIANLGFGMMVSIHTSSIIYYCSPFLNSWELKYRLLFSLLVLAGVGLGFYSQLRNVIQEHWLMPVRQYGHVIVVAKSVFPDKIRRGDEVAYMLSGFYFSNHNDYGIAQGTSLNLGPVLAMPGDNVVFSGDHFSVNGVSQKSLTHMPPSGTFVVQTNHWFIWPKMNLTNVRGNWTPDEKEVSDAMLQQSAVSEDQYVGEPLKHWFWRKQILQ